jgi:organic hydroperoxide reductase OsmC/OhrA
MTTAEHYYDVSVHWQEARKGVLTSTALKNSIEVVTPPEFYKGVPGIWSPEHLLVAAVNSCLMTTFLAIAENSKLDFLHFDSIAVGKLEKLDGKYIISEIKLKPVVTIADKVNEEKTLRLLHKSETACLISNSVKSKITLEPSILIADH